MGGVFVAQVVVAVHLVANLAVLGFDLLCVHALELCVGAV